MKGRIAVTALLICGFLVTPATVTGASEPDPATTTSPAWRSERQVEYLIEVGRTAKSVSWTLSNDFWAYP